VGEGALSSFMRILLLSLLFLSLSAFAKDKRHVVVPTEIHCFNLSTLIATLTDTLGEDPIFVGRSDVEKNATTMIFVNQSTGSYTILTADKNVGCVLDTGNDVRYRMPKSLENKLL
jgi:hypothetical protein